jgi:hypothetical protein
MCRFLSALIVLTGLFLMPDPAQAGSRSPGDPPLTAEERRQETGELLVVCILAGGIGTVVLIQGIREFVACLPRRRHVNLNDYYDERYDD